MKKTRVMLALLCATVFSLVTQAQVKGKVTDAKDGTPIVGATIKVKGKKLYATTTADGSFEISKADNGASLEVSYVGFTSQTVTGSMSTEVKLIQDTKSLSEVVVTALGIKKEKKSLGYSVSTVGKKDLEARPASSAVYWLKA